MPAPAQRPGAAAAAARGWLKESVFARLEMFAKISGRPCDHAAELAMVSTSLLVAFPMRVRSRQLIRGWRGPCLCFQAQVAARSLSERRIHLFMSPEKLCQARWPASGLPFAIGSPDRAQRADVDAKWAQKKFWL